MEGKKRCYHVNSGCDARDSVFFVGVDVSLREEFHRSFVSYSRDALDPWDRRDTPDRSHSASLSSPDSSFLCTYMHYYTYNFARTCRPHVPLSAI